MRCPKCSFISFDIVETCVKCGKNISAAAGELHGTVAAIGAPAFLHFDYQEPEPEAGVEGGEEGEVTFDLGGGEEEAVIDLGGEEAPTLDFGGGGEAPAEPAFDLGLSDEGTAVAEEEPQAAGFEISDLAPPQEEAAPAAEAVEELEFAAAEESQPSAQAGAGLADLKVEGIDLEAAPAKGKVMPSIKTGTALDEFDIDLGDLIPKKK